MGPDGSHGALAQIVAADVDDEVMRAMSTHERRYVLYYLLDHERVSLDQLAEVVAGWMAVTDGRVTTQVDHSSLVVSLYHNHLPHLADVGLVAFDSVERVVTRPDHSEAVRELVTATYLIEHRTEPPTE